MEVDAEGNFVRWCILCSRRRRRGRGGTLANFFAERGAWKSRKKQEFSIANKLKKQEKSNKAKKQKYKKENMPKRNTGIGYALTETNALGANNAGDTYLAKPRST